MPLTRRAWLTTASALPFAAAAAPRLLAAPSASTPASSQPDATAAPAQAPSYELPAKSEFAPMTVAYLNCGATHPMSLGSARAVQAYVAAKTLQPGAPPSPVDRDGVLAKFARLINAAPRDVCFVPSTTTAENLIVAALGLPAKGGRIVTDALHFYLSFYQHAELQRQGVDVVTLRLNAQHTVDLAQFAAALAERPTTLVIISHVSTFNGHVHDLKAITDLAHAHGALVYADLAHSAGSVPVDVRDSGVDFAACCTYKFLMGDMGAAFLYVNPAVLPRLQRPWHGHRQLSRIDTHLYPHETLSAAVADFTVRDDLTGFFEVGFPPPAVVAQLGYSLDWLHHAGIARIQAWRQPLMDTLQTELRRRGYVPLTPLGTASPNVAFAYENASRLAPKLDAAGVRATFTAHRFRLSVSVFNDEADIDRALRALS